MEVSQLGVALHPKSPECPSPSLLRKMAPIPSNSSSPTSAIKAPGPPARCDLSVGFCLVLFELVSQLLWTVTSLPGLRV